MNRRSFPVRRAATGPLVFAVTVLHARFALAQDAGSIWTASPGIAWIAGFATLFALALFLSLAAWRSTSRFAEVETRMQRSVIERRHAENALNAVLLERADGAAIWDGPELQLVTGTASSIRDLADPLSTAAVASVLVAEDSANEFTMLLEDLMRDGIGFEETFLDPEDVRRVYVGRAIGSRILLTVSDARRFDHATPSLADRVEQAERRAEALEAGFGAAPVYAWRRDGNGRLVWVNQRFVSGVEAPGLDAAIDCQIELLSGDDAANLRAMAERARLTGKPQTERHATILDGERRTLEVNESPFEDGTIGFAVDISAQVGASEALLRQISASNETLSRLNRGVAIFDTEGRLTFCNDMAAACFGIERAQLDSHPSLRRVLNLMRDENRAPRARNFETWRDEFLRGCAELQEADGASETTWHLPDGTSIHVAAQRHPAGGTMLVMEDTTGFHALKRDAATASAVYRAAFSRLAEGVIVIGLDGRCRLANPAFIAQWKLKQRKLQDAHITEIADFCRPLFNRDQVWQRIVSHVSAATEAREVWNETMERSDGSVLNMSTAPLPDGATMFAFRDITHSFNQERMLIQQNEALKEVSRLKSEFLNSIHSASHELKIPLNTIIGFSEILAHQMYGDLNKRQHEYIDGIYTASHELRQLIGGIIDLAMLENDYFAFRVEGIDVRAMLEAAIDFVHRNTAPGPAVALDCPAPVGEIPGDAPRFREIAYTLLNILQHGTPVSDSIEIGVRRGEDELTVWIGARQSPLPDNMRDILLNQLSRNSMPEFGRVALSISLVRQFIERQGGRISIETGIGRTREAVVYRMLTDADQVRAVINGERRPRELAGPLPIERDAGAEAQRAVATTRGTATVS